MAAKSGTKARPRAKKRRAAQSSLAWLLAGWLVAPLAFLSNLQANYTLTQMLCPGGRMLPLHLMTAFFLLASAAGGLVAWRTWERAGRSWPNESESKTMRSRFMGVVGLMLSVLCFLGIVWQWIPQFIFNPCQR